MNKTTENDQAAPVRTLGTSLALLAPTWAVAGSVLVAAVILWQFAGIPLGNLTRDPSNILDYPFYLGAISSLGVMLWTSTIAVCLHTSLLLRLTSRDRSIANMLLAAGLLTTALMLDDLFLFHEKFFPDYLRIPEYVVYSAYILGAGSFLLTFWRQILRSSYPILLAAGAFLGASMLSDHITNHYADTSIKFLIEDGLKLFGISAWATYFISTCVKETSAHMSSNGPELAASTT